MARTILFAKLVLTAGVAVLFIAMTVIHGIFMGRRMLFFLLTAAGTVFLMRAFTAAWKELERH